jgi:hypothetical protein
MKLTTLLLRVVQESYGSCVCPTGHTLCTHMVNTTVRQLHHEVNIAIAFAYLLICATLSSFPAELKC